MVRRITRQTQIFPQPHRGLGYWHLPLPVAQRFIDSSKIPFAIRRLCAQTLVNRAHHLSNITPQDKITRVVVAINLPELWRSQIIVFFDAQYFAAFFDRDTATQKWTPIGERRSLAREWNLHLPNDFSERGYREVFGDFSDEEFVCDGEIWFIGQVD